MKKLFVALLALLCFVLPLSAQQRGSQEAGGGAVEIVDARGDVVGRFTEAYALIIGESEYTNTTAWRKLPGVKEDVVAVEKLFVEQGFNVVKKENLNSVNLKSEIISFLDKYAFNPDVRIIVYYAGHGATVDLDGRKMGYIVPIDAPQASNNSNFLQTVIPMTQFETWAKQYTSRHILFMFDSCFAGSVFRSQSTTPPAINRLISQPVRQFITSGDANEEVPDESIFRKELEHALRNGAADTNKDGYVSGTELGLYLYNRVSNYMNGKQNPRIGKLNDTNLDKGDFIFFVNASQTGSSPGVVIIPDSQPQQNTNTSPITIQQNKSTLTAVVRFAGATLETDNREDLIQDIQRALNTFNVPIEIVPEDEALRNVNYNFLVTLRVNKRDALLVGDITIAFRNGNRVLKQSERHTYSELNMEYVIRKGGEIIRKDQAFFQSVSELTAQQK